MRHPNIRILFAVALAACGIIVQPASAQLINGYMHTGTILTNTQTETWTFTASAGDLIILRAGDTGSSTNYEPGIWLYGPDSALLASSTGGADWMEIALVATNSGTFSVKVGDGNSSIAGSGVYRITLIRLPGAITVAPFDEGGPMTNGFMHTGVISVGDLDAWTFSATNGDRIVLRAGNTTNAPAGSAGFTPGMRLFGPSGTMLAFKQGGADYAEIEVTATNTGTFTVLIGDATNSEVDSGTYRLTLAKSPGESAVSPNDEGGPMTNAFPHFGVISVGDLDVWSFSTGSGNKIAIQLTQLTGSASFYATMRLYSPDGTLLTNIFAYPPTGITNRLIGFNAPMEGSYTLVVSDASNNPSAQTGTYRLTAGIASGVVLSQPILLGTNDIVRGVGGQAGSNFVLLKSTAITLPMSNWVPIHTNQFGTFGEFFVTNAFSSAIPQQYYRARTP